MSDGEQELFDQDFDEGRVEAHDIFGQDEANPLGDELTPADDGFDAEGHEPATAAPTSTASDVSERRKALLQLAKRAKASEDAGPRKKKKAKPDKQADGTGSRPQRSKRGQHEQADEQQRQPQEFVEVNEDEIVETDADRNFIDDDGVPEDERYEEETERIQAAEEAEEVMPGHEEEPTNIVDEVLQRRKRARKKNAEQDVEAEVMQLTSMMAAVADDDSAAMDARPPRPAIEKLKHLGEVCSILKQKKFHDTFLASRGLHCLAGWLRPYSNGTLPNAKVRTELIAVLKLLQLDTTNDYIRERLEESELGKIIMFYYKNPNESMVLRSECRDLIQAWSAPIFADNDDENRKRRQRERAHRQRQAAERAERERREKQEHEMAERRRKLNPREEGFRARASVPQPSKMDFVINPGRTMDPLETQKHLPAAGGPKNKQTAIGGRLGKVLQQKKRGAQDRIGGVSVEGRGIQL